eukprot:5400795-Amphidinium_carterae.1
MTVGREKCEMILEIVAVLLEVKEWALTSQGYCQCGVFMMGLCIVSKDGVPWNGSRPDRVLRGTNGASALDLNGE